MSAITSVTIIVVVIKRVYVFLIFQNEKAQISVEFIRLQNFWANFNKRVLLLLWVVPVYYNFEVFKALNTEGGILKEKV